MRLLPLVRPCLLFALLAVPAQADRLALRDGTVHEGRFAGGEPGLVRFQVDGGDLLSVAVGELASLTFEAPPEPTVRVPSRTPLTLRLTQPIGHARHAGSPFKGVLENDLLVGGRRVAAAGTPALGRIADSSGRGGLVLRLTDLIIGGHRHRVTARPLPLAGTLDAQSLLDFELTSGFDVLESDLGR